MPDSRETAGCARQLCQYTAHSMGSNAASLVVTGQTDSAARLLICSGGDDQSLTCADLSLQLGDGAPITSTLDSLSSDPAASGSAIKGVSVLAASSGLFAASVGYDQRLSLWRVTQDAQGRRAVSWLAGAMVGVNDVGALHSVKHLAASDTFSCAVAGEGFEIVTVSLGGALK